MFNLIVTIFLAVCLNGCGSTSLKYNGKIQAGRDITIKGSGSSVDMGTAKIQSGRDVNMCADNGLTLPKKATRAPRDINIATHCKW